MKIYSSTSMRNSTDLRVGAIVEARMTSSRLPGKHLLPVLGRPIIGHLVHRLKSISLINDVVIAMTTRPQDDILEKYVRSIGAEVYRGDEDDVMGRVLCAAKSFDIDVICEVTGDCPIIDTNLIFQIVSTYLCNNADYVNNSKYSGLPDGMGCQVFSTSTLSMSASLTNRKLDREHVTLHIKRNPDLFSSIYLTTDPSLRWPELALTLDELDDYRLLKSIVEHFGESNRLFGCRDVFEFLRTAPHLVALNRHVKRRGET